MEELAALLPRMAQNYVSPQSPTPMKLMAASGTLPLPPQHLGLLLVCLAHDSNEQVAARARQTFGKQPPKVLKHLVDNPQQHPAALDFAARQLLNQSELLQSVLLHRNTSGETLTWLAGTIDGTPLEMLAQNQARQLAYPTIVQQLLGNQKLGTDLRAKVIEFALRHKLPTGLAQSQLRGLISDELLRELGIELEAEAPLDIDAPTNPDLVAVGDAAVELLEGIEVVHEEDFELPLEFEIEDDEDAPEEAVEEKKLTLEQQIMQMSVTDKIKSAIRGNKQIRSMLITDGNRLISGAVLKNPRITEGEVIKIASSRSVSEDIIRSISRNRDWMKIYQVKVSLVNNPKCPTGIAVRLVNHLRPSDLRNLVGNKNVPNVIATTAKKLMKTKTKR